MEAYRISSAKLVGSPGKYGWAQVHDFRSDDPLKFEARGQLLAVVSRPSTPTDSEETALDQVRLGREILTRVHEEYFGDISKSPLEALKGAIETVSKEFSSDKSLIEIGAAAILGNILYGAATNGAELMLLREGNLVRILKNAGRKVVFGSGRFKIGDFFLLGSSLFFKKFSLGVIKGALENSGPQTFAEVFVPSIHTDEGLNALAAFVFKIEPLVRDEETHHKESGSPAADFPRRGLGLRLKLAGLIEKIISVLPERRVVVRSDTVDIESKRRRRVAPFVGAILLIILGVSILFGVKARREKTLRERYSSDIEEISHEFNEAKTLANLDNGRARELILSAQDKAVKLRGEGVKDAELTVLLEEIDKSIGEIAGVYKALPQMFLDLSLVSSGFKGDFLAETSGRMLILDREGKRLVSVEIATKKTSVVAGPDYLPDAILATGYGERSFILSSDGIREVGEEVELLVKPEWDTKRVLVAAFGGNIYVLEKDNGKIWRYSGVRLGFADKQEWLGPGIRADFSKATTWAIDGSVWVLYEGGKLDRYSLGVPQNFRLTGPLTDLAGLRAIFADEEAKYLYLLDSTNKRVLVFDKNGEYKSEYTSDLLVDASQLVVSEKEKKIVFLAQGKLYSIEIKHLD